jgi:hypothetical protein
MRWISEVHPGNGERRSQSLMASALCAVWRDDSRLQVRGAVAMSLHRDANRDIDNEDLEVNISSLVTVSYSRGS